MINLLIADDNKEFDITLFNFIKKNIYQINIVGICVDGLDTYEKIKELNPDVVLLDIKMPTLNGFQIVDKLIAEKINIPKIILVTGHHEVLSSFNSSNFIYGILLKPINYNSLIETLNVIVEERNLDKFNNKVTFILSSFDFNVQSKGYKYLVECIKSCYTSPYLLNSLDKKLYPYISNHFIDTTPLKIKWSIEKTINSMYRYTDKETLAKFFPNSKKLSPRYFIETIISKANDC